MDEKYYFSENAPLANDSILVASVNLTTDPVAGLSGLKQPPSYPAAYRILATGVQSIIFLIGFFGNIMICVVVRKTRSLHTPTYCYLVSLAVADILLVSSAIPEQIISYHLYSKQWVLGAAGCRITVFASYLAINAGSISILAFTVERYIAICHPMLAQKVCTASRARRIIALTWLVVGVYCAPWLGLAGTKPLQYADQPEMIQCSHVLPRQHHLPYYLADFIIFYVVPLLISCILYTRMGVVLYRSVRAIRTTHKPLSASFSMSTSNWATARKPKTKINKCFNFRGGNDFKDDSLESSCFNGDNGIITGGSPIGQQPDNQTAVMRSRCQVVKMLIIVVVCFAVLWLPYRGLLVYNSVVERPWQNMWYMLFAKTAVYINSAINPFLYTVLSRKFRSAFFRIICFWRKKRFRTPRMAYSMTEMSLRSTMGATLTTSVPFPSSHGYNEKRRLRGSSSPQSPP